MICFSLSKAITTKLKKNRGCILNFISMMIYNLLYYDVSFSVTRTNFQLIYYKENTYVKCIYFLIFQTAKINFPPFKSLFLHPFPASMSSGSDKVDTVADGFFKVHAKLSPGAKHNGRGNMARDQKISLFEISFPSH